MKRLQAFKFELRPDGQQERQMRRFPQGMRLDQPNSRIFLPKLGWLRYRNSRDVLGTIKNVTVSQSGGKWFMSIQSERDVQQPVPKTTSAVGIDKGIARFDTLSDGRDYLHKNSTAISQNHAIVCIEDLQVGNMSQSAAGTHRSDSGAAQCRA